MTLCSKKLRISNPYCSKQEAFFQPYQKITTIILKWRIIKIVTAELLQLNILVFSLCHILNCSLICFTGKLPEKVVSTLLRIGNPGERKNASILFSDFQLCHSVPSLWYLLESIQKEYAAKCCNFWKMTLGTNSWSQYLKKMGHWNIMTIKRNDSALERFSKMGVSTSSIKRINS